MQWVDNPFKFDTKRAIIDMIQKDKLSIFYRGLIPMMNGQIFLYITTEWARKLVFEYQLKFMDYCWPVLVGLGWLLAHPHNVLASKVYCGRFTHPREQYIWSNSLQIMNYIVKKHGIKSLYVGFGPAMMLYTCFYHKILYYLTLNSYNSIFNK